MMERVVMGSGGRYTRHMSRSQSATITAGCGELVLSPDTRGTSVPHFHLTHAIGVNRSGAGTLHTMGRQWDFDVDTIVVTNPFDVHWGEAGRGALDYFLFYPDPGWLASLPFAGGSSATFRFEVAVLPDGALAARLKLAFEKMAASRGAIAPSGAIDELFAAHARAEGIPGRLACESASALFATDPAAPISNWASSSGLSRAHYSREYRRTVGLSPLNHRRQNRVLAARHLIENGASLAAAAAEAGFSDQAHMTRQFRQILGVTPTAFMPPAEHKRSRPGREHRR